MMVPFWDIATLNVAEFIVRVGARPVSPLLLVKHLPIKQLPMQFSVSIAKLASAGRTLMNLRISAGRLGHKDFCGDPSLLPSDLS